MTETDENDWRARVAQLRETFPEGYSFVRDLFTLGMVPGWRALVRVGPDNKEKK